MVGDKWNNKTFDWIRVTESMRKLGFSADIFVKFKIATYTLNNTRKMLYVSSYSMLLAYILKKI